MKRKVIKWVIFFCLVFISYNSFGQRTFMDILLPKSDSNIVENRKFFIRFPSITVGASFPFVEEPVIGIFGLRLDANIITPQRRRLILYNSINLGSTNWTGSVFLLEVGIMTGFFKGKSQILDVSYGICYTRRYILNLFSYSGKNLSDFHSIGIPFNIGILSKNYPVNIDLGVVGNINPYHPYIAANFRLRLGNPAKRSMRD